MALRDEMEREGEWLFRWRSYLPLLMLLVIGLAAWAEDAYARPPALAFQLGCFGLGVAGILVRVLVAGYVPKRTSGRNTGKGQVADALNSTGIYSVVRHPLYLGNYLMYIACVAVVGIGWLVACLTLAFWLYYERIMLAEERFLRGKFGEDYDRWAEGTPAFWPRLKGWKRAALPFCWRTALKREYASVFGFVAAFTVLAQGPRLVPYPWARFDPDPVWTSVLGGFAAAYGLVRVLRKRKVLSVEGR